MKKISPVILSLLFCITAYAQQANPVIKQGTTLKYVFELHGQHAPFQMKIDYQADTLSLLWNIRGMAGGTYIIAPEALNNGNRMNFAQPVPMEKTRLASNETFCMISR